MNRRDFGTVGVYGYDTQATPSPGWSLLRRPARLVDQTRWLFTLLVLVSAVLSLVGVVIADSELTSWPLAALGYGGLVAIWVGRLRSGRAPVLLDVVEAALVLAVAVAGPDTVSVMIFLFAALWLRALYSARAAVLRHAGFMAVALVGSALVWPLLPGRSDATMVAGAFRVFGTVPAMFLTAFVAAYLARSMFAREQSQERDGALLRLSNRLIEVSSPPEIQRAADDCATAICAATPGIRLVVALVRDGVATVVHRAGPLTSVPRTIPLQLLPTERGRGVQPLPDSPLWEEMGAAGAEWIGLPLADGTEGWLLVGGSPRVPAEAVVAIGSMTNQVALAIRNCEAHQDLTTQAAEDPLTGLANRAAFTAALESALADGDRQVALLFLDLDDFKIVNDGLGHSAGDELLRHVADRLRAGVRTGDLCARLGGDEFAVLLPDVDDDAVLIGQRLVERIAAPVTLRGRRAQVGASVGLAFAAEDVDASGEQLVQRADVAMYAAKAKGKNRVQVFDASLLQEDGRVRFESELAAAAAADELVVHYQPIVSVRDGRCVAVEALVRWQHPARGLLPPAEFIPAAERTGAIVDIGALVLRRACADAAGWSGPAGPLAVHVNVSAAQLTDPDFVGIVRSCLADHAMAPGRLVLEITEGMVLDSTAVRDALEELAAIGIAIAIDDFGTGYSALSTLRTLPLNIVKIDKSFLATGPSGAADEAVVEAIVALAGRLGLQVVGEGVERVDQQQFLCRVGADAAQGYLHLRPTPAAHFTRWLDQRNALERSVQPLGPRRIG